MKQDAGRVDYGTEHRALIGKTPEHSRGDFRGVGPDLLTEVDLLSEFFDRSTQGHDDGLSTVDGLGGFQIGPGEHVVDRRKPAKTRLIHSGHPS
jgi:hypothetical protein